MRPKVRAFAEGESPLVSRTVFDATVIRFRAGMLLFGRDRSTVRQVINARLDDFGCFLCGKPFTTTREACIDHDHSTDEIRGVLCMPCNLALGGLKDNPGNALRAALYLLSTDELLPAMGIQEQPTEQMSAA